MGWNRPKYLTERAMILTMRIFYHTCRNVAWKLALFKLLTHHYIGRHTLKNWLRKLEIPVNWKYFELNELLNEKNNGVFLMISEKLHMQKKLDNLMGQFLQKWTLSKTVFKNLPICLTHSDFLNFYKDWMNWVFVWKSIKEF